MKTCLTIAFTTASMLAMPMLTFAENEIGFIERFALAPDREKVLGELVPGTEEFYFYHALHYQNTRNAAKLAETLEQWKKRFPDESYQRRIILNREALLSYDADPQATLAYLKRQFNVQHNHQQEVRDQKPNLPTELDAKRIDRSVFLADALKHDDGLQGLSQEALADLIKTQAPLSMHQRRGLLGKLQRPAVPGLVEFIAQELGSQESRGFGEFAIHRALLPEQLEELVKAMPELALNERFVFTKMRKLAPSADVNLEDDNAEREAWLTRVWDYAKTLPPAFNSLKAQALYLRLDHDRKAGIYNPERFTEYLQLPRSAGYVAKALIENAALSQQPLCDLNANMSEALLSQHGIGDDEPLVLEYFLHLFAVAPSDDVNSMLSPFTRYVRDTWLKPVLAEALITSGKGNVERWASLLSPSEFQALKERVDIEFPATNAPTFKPGDDVQFDVVLKNTPKLLVKIYELNTLNFFLAQKRQLNTDLNLDGLVANTEQTRSFESGPFKRERVAFKFDELKGKRGAWIIEFIGGGRSSRALVRVGQWQALQQTGPSGDLLLVLDENGDPVKDAVAWLDGRKLTVDEKLQRIVVPYTAQPGMKNIVLASADSSFATLTQFEHHSEDYKLDAQFHIEREQLLGRREATLAVRTALMLGETHLAPELLIEPKLTLTSTTLDGISTTREVKDLKLSAGSVFTHKLAVPEHLASLTATLRGKVEVLSASGEKRDLQASRTWTLNGIDKTELVSDGHLSVFDDQRVFELLGKNGEPVADQQIVFEFKHRDFQRVQRVALRTDVKGRVMLGKLNGIASVSVQCPNSRKSAWPIESEARAWPTTLHVKAGEAVRVTQRGTGSLPVGAPQMQDNGANQSRTGWQPVSLLAVTAGTFIADHSDKIKVIDGSYVIEGLPVGDYSLSIPDQPTARLIEIKVTAGKQVGGWLLGKHRNLQVKDERALAITSIDSTSDKEFITVKLANVAPFTRVHVAASRFDPGRGLFDSLASFSRFGAASGIPAQLPNLYSAGREIGDEYRYILERKYAKRYPGNTLTRPGLLLNPWEVTDTDQDELSASAGAAASSTRGGSAGAMKRAMAMAAPKPQGPSGAAAESNLDFLADSAPVLYNLIPDKDGLVRIERKTLGDRQHIQVYAEDLSNAAWQTISLPEVPTKLADQRLARNLDPAKAFTQKKEITVLAQGQTLTLADILTSELETYDTLSGIHSLFLTNSHNEDLAKFAWVLQWPKLSDADKRAKYSEFACHELSFFIARKDHPFFEAVVRPHLANKKDQTFMDHFLLGHDLKHYLETWAYGQLNAAERCLLAQRIDGEAPNAARHLRELWELQPHHPEYQDSLFETALRGRALELGNDGAGSALEKAKADAETSSRRDSPIPRAMMVMESPPPAPAAAPADAFAAAPPPPGSPMVGAKQRFFSDSKVADLGGAEMQLRQASTFTGALTLSGTVSEVEGAFGYFGKDAAGAARAQVRAYFRALGPTKEWAENNYWHAPIEMQTSDLVTVNAFWRDYAAWVAAGSKGAFVSEHVAEATGNFTEMMLALAVLDLPFEAAKHTTKTEGTRFDFTAGGPVIVYHKEIKTAAAADAQQGQLLVSQSFFRAGDRYRQEGQEKFEKYVTDEFLTGTVYGANVVVTNPTSAPTKATVLLQIPQGALPVNGSKATDSKQLRLEPYTTKTFEYEFYFPAVAAKAGAKFAHFPVSVAVASGVAGSAKPFEFNVVAKLTQVDKASWDYVSQYGSEADVMTFLVQNNLESLNLERIAWRCRHSVDFYKQLVALLNTHHVWDEAIASYALLHNDAGTLREWLKHHHDPDLNCGPYFASTLVTLDPVERQAYQHLEYSPLVNQRAHRLGNEWRIANTSVLWQYQHLLEILAHKPQLDAADSLSVTYYLFLQDRVEEALARLDGINSKALPSQMQLDYLHCYAAFYEDKLDEAKIIASKYANYPVARWQAVFADVGKQIEESRTSVTPSPRAPGATAEDQADRASKANADLAATEPTFDFKVENKTIALTWKNLPEVTLNYYLMDPEFSFSSSPFVSQDASRFSIIKPNSSAKHVLPAGKDALEIPLPAEYAKANVLVEVVGAGQRKAQAYHANTLKLALTENYGRLEARDSGTDKPVSKAYVKVYARLQNGTLRFFKDGYTDLRGRFDYASLNGPLDATPQPAGFEAPPANGLDYPMLKPAEMGSIQRLAVLVLSETNGAMVKEVAPPQR